MRTSDLIRQAGVTRKTLRLYEEKALIDPPRSVDNGYREYDREAVERIHTIRLLQAIGFSLAEIRTMIGGAKIDWAHTLELQESAADDEAVIGLIGASPLSDEELGTMRDNVSRYYNDKAKEVLANHPATPDEIQAGTNAWTAIIAEVDGMIRDGKDPGSPQGQAIVKRMDALIAAFTLGNPDVETGLNKMYADRPNWPTEAQSPYSVAVWEYVGRMREAAKGDK